MDYSDFFKQTFGEKVMKNYYLPAEESFLNILISEK